MPTRYRDVLDAAPIGWTQRGVVAMLTGVMIVDGVDLLLAAFSAPKLMHEWRLTKPHFAPLLAAALVGMLLGTLVGSWTGDRYGRKPTLVSSVAVFGLMTLVCATATTPSMFIACRFITGLGFGAAFPVATAMISEWMPRRAAGKAISIMTIGIPLGAVLGSAAAAWVLPHYGWRYGFAGVGALCLLLAGGLLWGLPESPSFLILNGRRPQAAALLSRAFARPPGVDWETLELEPPRPSGGGVFTRDNTRVNLGLWLSVLANSCATYAVGGWLTVILVDLHLPLATALRGPLTVSLSAIVGAIAVGWLLARLGTRPVMLALTSLACVSAAAMSAAVYALPSGSQLFSILFVGLAVGGFCSGGLQPAFYVLASEAYETQSRSRGVGATAFMGRVGAVLSSFAGGAVLAQAHGGGFFAMTAILSVVAAAGMLLINRHIPRLGPPVRDSLRRAPELTPGYARSPGSLP